MDDTEREITQDERTMGALAHVSILLPMTGMLAPVLIWVTQKDKSAWVRLHALQAIGWHVAMMLAVFLGMALYVVFFFATFVEFSAAAGAGRPSDTGFVSFGLAFLTIFGIFAVQLGMILYGAWGAFVTFQGRYFRYPIVGPWVETQAAAP